MIRQMLSCKLFWDEGYHGLQGGDDIYLGIVLGKYFANDQ